MSRHVDWAAYPDPEEEVNPKKGARGKHKQNVFAQTLHVLCSGASVSFFAYYSNVFTAGSKHIQSAS